MSAPRSPGLLAKDLGGLFIYYPGQALVSKAPRRGLSALSRLGGDLVRRLNARDLSEAREELSLLFGDRPLPRPMPELLREAWRQMMFNELEVLRYPHLTPERIDEVCAVEGREHLDAALARGKGAIVLIGHFGANQMIMPALGHLGYPMNQLSAPPPVWADILRETRTTPLWEKVLERRWVLEQRLPVRHINVFRFLRPAVDCLKDNQVLGLAFDGGGGRRWAEVSFMARRAQVSVQPAQLARLTGAAILPTLVFRDPDEQRHRVVIHPPLEVPPGGKQEQAQRTMQAFVDVFSEWVAKRPSHYVNFLLLRRRVRATDVVPFFDDYPAAEGQMTPEQAQAHLEAAGARER